MEKNKNKYKKRNIILTILLVINIAIICLFVYCASPVSKNSKDVEFIVSSGDSLTTIGSNLKKQGLIKRKIKLRRRNLGSHFYLSRNGLMVLHACSA